MKKYEGTQGRKDWSLVKRFHNGVKVSLTGLRELVFLILAIMTKSSRCGGIGGLLTCVGRLTALFCVVLLIYITILKNTRPQGRDGARMVPFDEDQLQQKLHPSLGPSPMTADLDPEGVNSVLPLTNVTRVFYNRVPKCGSRTILRVFDELTKRNNVINKHSNIFNTKQLTPTTEADFVKKFMGYKTPMLHDRHLYFVDFKKYGHEMPMYINLIRDPFERILSRHYYILYESARTPDATKNQFNMSFTECVQKNERICMSPANLIELVRYFCGQDPVCESKGGANNPTILKRAKENVQKYYAVVGVIEDAEAFFMLLEKRLPEFFDGAPEIYAKMMSKLEARYKNSQKIMPADDIKNYVISRMSEAYEFYQFVKQRQYNMLSSLQLM